jgi:hypothetical protein
MFYNNGQVVVDMCIKFDVEHRYPYSEYYITPRYGKVPVDNVIEVREPSKDTDDTGVTIRAETWEDTRVTDETYIRWTAALTSQDAALAVQPTTGEGA